MGQGHQKCNALCSMDVITITVSVSLSACTDAVSILKIPLTKIICIASNKKWQLVLITISITISITSISISITKLLWTLSRQEMQQLSP